MKHSPFLTYSGTLRIHGFIIAFSLAIFFAASLRAQQTPLTVPSAGGEADARSPSITSIPGTSKLVCAYVVNENNLPRIHVATSANNGISWTDQGDPDHGDPNGDIPSFINGNGEACMDEPQVIEDDYVGVGNVGNV